MPIGRELNDVEKQGENSMPPGWESMSRAERWQWRNVYVKLPRCPVCKNHDMKTNASRDAKAEGAIRKKSVRCKRCGWTFKILEE